MPHPILTWGADCIAWLQQASPALDTPFRIITWLGSASFVGLFVAIIYWSVDRRAGLQLGLFYALSTILNGAVKVVLRQPRPAELFDHIQALIEQDGYGLPSGHTQNAVVLWGTVASRWRRRWVWIGCGMLILLVPLSRIYLGVHFPTDVLAGYLLGGLLLWILLRHGPIFAGPVARPGLIPLLISAALVATLPILDRLSDDGLQIIGGLWGLAVGLYLERRHVRFTTAGSRRQRIERAFLGTLLLSLLYAGLGQTARYAPWSPIWLLMRYALSMLWCAWGAPALFVHLGLAAREEVAPASPSA